jgi:hypothetical protein
MRLFISVLATAAMILVASTAGAVEFRILGDAFATVLPDEQVTIDIVITNDDGTGLNGIGASVTDYGLNELVSGEAVGTYLNNVCYAPGACFNGLTNLAAGPLVESSIGANGNRIQIALSAGLVTVFGASPSVDQGLDLAEGSAQFTVTFTAKESASIQVGTSYQGDGVILPNGDSVQAQGATFELTVVPEPGTALLMGLGLAGLAAAGRRE